MWIKKVLLPLFCLSETKPSTFHENPLNSSELMSLSDLRPDIFQCGAAEEPKKQSRSKFLERKRHKSKQNYM